MNSCSPQEYPLSLRLHCEGWRWERASCDNLDSLFKNRATRTEFVCTVHSSSKCLPCHITTRIPDDLAFTPPRGGRGFPRPAFLGIKILSQHRGEDMNASAGRKLLVNHVTVQHIRMPTHADTGRSRKKIPRRSGPGGGGPDLPRRSPYLDQGVRLRQVDPGLFRRQATMVRMGLP